MDRRPFFADPSLCPLSREKGISYLFTSTKTIQRFQETYSTAPVISYKRLAEHSLNEDYKYIRIIFVFRF